MEWLQDPSPPVGEDLIEESREVVRKKSKKNIKTDDKKRENIVKTTNKVLIAARGYVTVLILIQC